MPEESVGIGSAARPDEAGGAAVAQAQFLPEVEGHPSIFGPIPSLITIGPAGVSSPPKRNRKVQSRLERTTVLMLVCVEDLPLDVLRSTAVCAEVQRALHAAFPAEGENDDRSCLTVTPTKRALAHIAHWDILWRDSKYLDWVMTHHDDAARAMMSVPSLQQALREKYGRITAAGPATGSSMLRPPIQRVNIYIDRSVWYERYYVSDRVRSIDRRHYRGAGFVLYREHPTATGEPSYQVLMGTSWKDKAGDAGVHLGTEVLGFGKRAQEDTSDPLYTAGRKLWIETARPFPREKIPDLVKHVRSKIRHPSSGVRVGVMPHHIDAAVASEPEDEDDDGDDGASDPRAGTTGSVITRASDPLSMRSLARSLPQDHASGAGVAAGGPVAPRAPSVATGSSGPIAFPDLLAAAEARSSEGSTVSEQYRAIPDTWMETMVGRQCKVMWMPYSIQRPPNFTAAHGAHQHAARGGRGGRGGAQHGHGQTFVSSTASTIRSVFYIVPWSVIQEWLEAHETSTTDGPRYSVDPLAAHEHRIASLLGADGSSSASDSSGDAAGRRRAHRLREVLGPADAPGTTTAASTDGAADSDPLQELYWVDINVLKESIGAAFARLRTGGPSTTAAGSGPAEAHSTGGRGGGRDRGGHQVPHPPHGAHTSPLEDISGRKKPPLVGWLKTSMIEVEMGVESTF